MLWCQDGRWTVGADHVEGRCIGWALSETESSPTLAKDKMISIERLFSLSNT